MKHEHKSQLESTCHKLRGNYIEFNYAYSFNRVVEFLYYGVQYVIQPPMVRLYHYVRKSTKKIVSRHVQTLDRPVAYKLFLPFTDVVSAKKLCKM